MSRKNKYLIAYFAIVAALIGYGVFFCVEMDKLAPWTESDNAFIIPIGILSGLGFFVSKELWDEIKKGRKKK